MDQRALRDQRILRTDMNAPVKFHVGVDHGLGKYAL